MDLGGAVLDELRFVEDEPRPLAGGDLVLIKPEDRVRDDDDISPGGHLGEGDLPLPPGLTDDANVEVRGDLRRLLRPHRNHGGGGDDEERRALPAVGPGPAGTGAAVAVPLRAAGVGDERERLHGLAEPHVVGEDPAETAPVEEGQPTESLHLIRAEGDAVEFGHLGGRQMLEITQGLRGLAPGHGGFGLVGEVFELGPQTDVEAADLRGLGFPFGDEVRLGEEGLEPVEDGTVEGEVRVVGELELALALRERGEELDEGHGPPADADLEAKLEPVVLLRLDRGDLHARLPTELTVGLTLPARDDVDVLDLFEPRQDRGDEVGGVDVGELEVCRCRREVRARVGRGERLRQSGDLGDDGVLVVDVAQFGVPPRRGGARVRLARSLGAPGAGGPPHRQGPARTRVLPVPAQAQSVLRAEGEVEGEPRIPVVGEADGFVGAHDLGARARQPGSTPRRTPRRRRAGS